MPMRPDPESIPNAITAPFRVVVDTREQLPWHFTGITQPHPAGDDLPPLAVIVPLVTGRALETGDYSIEGDERLFAIERKSKSDLLQSITADRERFEREFERMAVISGRSLYTSETPGGLRGAAHVVCEADWTELLQLPESSQVSPKAIVGTVASWSQRYGVHFWFLPGRRAAERWAFWLMWHWAKQRDKLREREPQGKKETIK